MKDSCKDDEEKVGILFKKSYDQFHTMKRMI